MVKLRKAQQEVLRYRAGRMAISAVPGSGKTTTLSLLAAELIERLRSVPVARQEIDSSQPHAWPLDLFKKVAEGGLQPAGMRGGPTVLVVTFSNAGVANFRSRIARLLEAKGLPRQTGYDVRTLHSLAHLVVQEQPALAGLDSEFRILDGRETDGIARDAARIWIQRNEGRWLGFFDERLDDWTRRRWETITLNIARTTIRTAKTARFRPDAVLDRLEGLGDSVGIRLARMGAEIYQIYQDQLDTRGAVDFDDLVWLAYEILRDHPALLEMFRRRWPYILEDEAQDSSPLQEELLELLVGPDGNWVRVGDPNQAINATFTSADPRYFRQFCGRSDVHSVTLDQSGRSSEQIIDLANELVRWACEDYREPAIRERAFTWQMIRPVDRGDPQPNPPLEESAIALCREYADWQQELKDAAVRAMRYAELFPAHTLAILVPTNFLGDELVKILRSEGAEFDELLNMPSSTRSVTQALSLALDFALDPSRGKALSDLFLGLADAELLDLPEGVTTEYVGRLLASSRAEQLLYPEPGTSRRSALPTRSDTTLDDHVAIDRFAELVAPWARAASLPVDGFVLTVGSELFGSALDLAIVQQVAALMRRLADDNPSWRMPELASELHEIAFGARGLPGMGRDELGFEPERGKITVATMHGAKGLEWDLVYLVGVDRSWFPERPEDCYSGGLDLMEGDPEAEVAALLRSVLAPSRARVTTRSPTLEAQLELISERLRLLYVGITRARRNLCISWGREAPRSGGRYSRTVDMAPALGHLRAVEYGRPVGAAK